MRKLKKCFGAFGAVLVAAGAWAGCGGKVITSDETAGAAAGAGGTGIDSGKKVGASGMGGSSGTGGSPAIPKKDAGRAGTGGSGGSTGTGGAGPVYSLTACPGALPRRRTSRPEGLRRYLHIGALRARFGGAHQQCRASVPRRNQQVRAGRDHCAERRLRGKKCTSTLDPNMVGTCVPTCLIPPMYQGVVAKEDCTGTRDLCAPCTTRSPCNPQARATISV